VAVSGTFRVDVRPYSGYDNPSLPIAAWIAQAGIVGDASGGDLFINFEFRGADDNQVSELFNLEQMAIDTSSGAAAEDLLMDTRNMDSLAQNRPVSDQRWAISLANIISGEGVALPMTRSNILPIWLGAPNGVEGESGLRFQFDNVDLQLYQIVIQGYIWGPRSVLAQGGPQRPVGGLFGNG